MEHDLNLKLYKMENQREEGILSIKRVIINYFKIKLLYKRLFNYLCK